MAVEGIPGLLRWAPFTSYKAGERFAAPNGDIVTANIDFTSGATYSATNVTASAQDERIAALEVLGGVSPGDTSDSTVSTLLNSATLTRDALDARYVNEGTPVSNTEIAGMVTAAGPTQTALDARYRNESDPLPVIGDLTGTFFNVLDYGVKGDNTTNDTANLNTALDTIFTLNPDAWALIPPLNYKIDGTVTARGRVYAYGAQFNYTGNGDCLVVGSPTAITQRRMFILPRVVKQGRTNLWDGTSRGIVLYNLFECDVWFQHIQDFEYGLYCMGNNQGFSYNRIYMGTLWENHVQQVLDCTNTGYINENTFYKGRWQRSLSKGATLDDPNAYEVYAVSQNAEGGPNNNVWINPCIEGPTVAYYRVYINGSHNEFNHGRWETPGNATFRIRWGANSVSNLLFYGYGLVNAVEQFDNTTGTISPSIRYDSAGLYLNATNATAGQVIPNNVTTDITTWAASPTMRGLAYNQATGEWTPRPGRWRIHAKVSFAINGTGRRQAYLIGGGVNLDDDEIQPSATNRGVLRMTGVRRFNGSETFKVQVNQTSGADLALETSSGRVKISADYLGG